MKCLYCKLKTGTETGRCVHCNTVLPKKDSMYTFNFVLVILAVVQVVLLLFLVCGYILDHRSPNGENSAESSQENSAAESVTKAAETESAEETVPAPETTVPQPAVPEYADVEDGIYMLWNVGAGYYLKYSPNNDDHRRMMLYPADSSSYRFLVCHPYGGILNIACMLDEIAAEEEVNCFEYDDFNNTQRFLLREAGDGCFVLANAEIPELVITPPNGAVAANLVLRNYEEGNALQQWELQRVQIPDGTYRLRSVGTGSYLRYNPADPEGVSLILAENDDSIEEKFALRREGGNYRLSICHPDGGFVNCFFELNDDFPNLIEGVRVNRIHEPYTDGSQNFYITESEDGNYILRTGATPELVVGLQESSGVRETLLQTFYSGDTFQEWQLEPVS